MPDSANESDPAVWRILDANQNRAREALRVIEEYLRFSLNDAHLTGVAKQLRHRLQAALSRLPRDSMLRARDTLSDVGTAVSTEAERTRSGADAVVAAAFSRAEQSLRALEEYGKVVDSAFAVEMERLRYDVYTLEKSAAATRSAAERLENCRIYVLIDGADDHTAFARRVERLISAGVDAIQLRDKRLGERTLLARARLLANACRGNATLAIVNDRPDIALLAHADGVHVGQDELPVAEVRRVVGPQMLIGLSTHTIEQARDGVLAGADYLGVGPVFPSGTKEFAELAGIEFVRQVAAEVTLPAFAIGGIDAGNVEQVAAGGMRRIAVSAAVDVEDVESAVEQLRRGLAAN